MFITLPSQRSGTAAWRWLVAFTLFAILSGCATHSEIRRQMVDDVRLGYYQKAESRLEKLHEDSSKKDLLMDLMDKGLILHQEGRYAESNRTIEKAKTLLDELYGVDISDELSAIAWNEASRAFEGEEFERVMLNLIAAFNYLQLGDLESAGVEARQLNHRLQVYVDKLARNNVKSRYVQDPFAQYLAGMIQEALGEQNDAFRSYENAYEGYLAMQDYIGLRVPTTLEVALLRSARALGYEEAIVKYEKIFRESPAAKPGFWKDRAKLVVIAGLGEVAHKVSEKWMIPDPQFDVIVVTYPKFVRGRFMASHATVEVSGKREVQMGLAHDLSTLAITTLDDKNDQVKGRAVAKMLLRYAAKKVTKNVALTTKNDTAKALLLLGNIALNIQDIVEEADTRSWMTLPDHYRIAVLALPPGNHRVVVRFRGGRGMIDEQVVPVRLKAGETRFLITRGREAGDAADPAPQPATAGGNAAPAVSQGHVPKPDRS